MGIVGCRKVLVVVSACGTLAVNACGLDASGTAPPYAEAGVAQGDQGGAGTTSADASTDAGSVPTVDATIDIGAPANCKDVLARDPSTVGKSGAYSATLYCDMEIDGGGWTLVGRSAKDGKGPFGWSTRAGSIADLTKPYSMDVVSAGLVFSEIMFADRDPTAHAYKIQVASDFLMHKNDRMKPGTAITLVGSCTPNPAVTMFKFVGATAVTDAFFFRDIDDLGQHRGLHADKWDVAYSNCLQGGSIDGSQGWVFVR